MKILIICLFLSSPIFSQNIDYKITQRMFPMDASIKLDHKGFMWIGNGSEGLIRYDGYNFKKYEHNPEDSTSISSNHIGSIFQDPQIEHIFWIRTSHGLNKFNLQTEKFVHYHHDSNNPYSINFNYISDIQKYRKGILYLMNRCIAAGGLNLFNNGDQIFIPFSRDSTGLLKSEITDSYIDQQDNMWISSRDGLFRLEQAEIETSLYSDSLSRLILTEDLDSIAVKLLKLIEDYGSKFTKYLHDPNDPYSLPSNFVKCVFEDRQGVLWFGCAQGGGIRIFDPRKDKFLKPEFKTENKTIFSQMTRSIYEDSFGQIWLALKNGGLIKINAKRDSLKHYLYKPDETNSLNQNNLTWVNGDRSDNIFTSGFSMNAINFLIPNRKSILYYQHNHADKNSLIHNTVHKIIRDRSGDLWITTKENTLHKFETDQRIFTHYNLGIFHDTKGVSCDSDNNLWIARQEGLTKFDPRILESIHYTNLSFVYPQIIYKKSDKIITKNHCFGSISQVDDNQSVKVSAKVKKATKALLISFGEYKDGKLVDYGWLAKADQKENIWEMQRFNTKHAASRINVSGLNKNRIQISLVHLEPGDYNLHYRTNSEHTLKEWTEEKPIFPFSNSIAIYEISLAESKEIQPFLMENCIATNLPSPTLTKLKVVKIDKHGRIWCLFQEDLEYHVYRFNEYKKEFSKLCSIDIYGFISDFLLGREGTLWMSSNGTGLIRINTINDSLESIQYLKNDVNNPQSISSNNVHCIYQDSRNRFWIGTSEGLNRFYPEEEVFIRYGLSEGLNNLEVNSILEDESGNLWLATDKGISKFNIDTESFENFDLGEGDELSGFLPGLACKSNSGEIFFGGTQGIVSIDPRKMEKNPHVPPIVITDLKLFNKAVKPDDDSPFQKSIAYCDEIILPHDQNVLTLEFAALDYTDPSKNQYAYQMEGIDPDWNYVDSNQRFANYTKLPPGEYTFRVKGSNNDGVWNEEGTSLRVIILPPWWQTAWAYAFYIFIFTGIITFTWRMQVRRIQIKHQLEMEHFQAEKLTEVDHLKSRFFANISHEFRTPITLIEGPLQQLSEGKFAGDVKKTYHLMLRNSRRLLNLINQLLDLSKIEAGKAELRVTLTDLVISVRNLCSSFIPLADPKNISLNLNPKQKSIHTYLDKDKFEKIMNNLLSNAFKFTPEGGRIEVTASKNQHPPNSKFQIPNSDFVQITISNTGPGIPVDKIDKIFDRFYQAEHDLDRQHEGSGIGLALVKEIVELHHGYITANCCTKRNTHLTTFSVWLPMGKETYQDDVISEQKTIENPVVINDKYILPIIIDTPVTSPGQTSVASKSKPLILVVEDNRDMRLYLYENLKEQHRIIEAKDGREGLEKALQKFPDLIITDIMMPHMDGYKFCAKVKTDLRISHIPVVLLTAKADKQSRIEGLETGADDYIAKPFDMNELLVRSMNLIKQRQLLRLKFAQQQFLQPENITNNSLDEKLLIRLRRIVFDHLNDPDFSVAKLAREIGMSRVHLHRKLSALTNHSTSTFIRILKLQKAAELIEKKTASISEIAFEVGFNNLSYFARKFREYFGTSPSQFVGAQK